MSLHAAAQHLAAKGRGEDKVLIHMTPGEVHGLQAIAKAHGGSLTINPETGLPEAGFLSKILPMVAGAALAATGVGAPMAALMVGGGTGLMTGDLKKGLMAGLGAYGGAGLAGGLAAAGAAPAAEAATASNLGSLNPALVESGTSGSLGAALEHGALTAPRVPFAELNPALIESGTVGDAGQTLENIQLTRPTVTTSPIIPEIAAPNAPILGSQKLGDAYAGLQNIANNPTQGLSNLWQGMGDTTKQRLMTTAALASPLLEQEPKEFPTPQGSGPNPYSYTYQPNITTPFPLPNVPGYDGLNQNFGREQRYYSGQYVPTAAEGGAVQGYAMGGIPVGAMNSTYPQAGLSQSQYANAWQTPVPREMLASGTDTGVNPMNGQMSFAQGGISDLGGYSDGGRLLRGPGDGVSDSIPAMIGNKQPARLADGEFVVPARIVSELGNGSTESGARKLYAMMDRVQKARGKTVGKSKIAANSRADKYLPA